MPPRLTKSFFARDGDTVARDLLGCLLVRILDDVRGGTRVTGRIVETEAYLGPEDQASHARNNRRTPRNEPMYGPPGLSYVYFTYGMHFCMNVSCKAKTTPPPSSSALLSRSTRSTPCAHSVAQGIKTTTSAAARPASARPSPSAPSRTPSTP